MQTITLDKSQYSDNTAKIIGKLRNARFRPPGGGPKEKLAWINDGEANLLRLNGGSGKRRKFGLPSFSYGDSHYGGGFGAHGTGVDRSDSSGASSGRNSGVGGVGSQMQQNRDGSLSRIAKADVNRLGVAVQPRVVRPAPLPIAPLPLPVAVLPPVPIPRMKPPVPMAPTITPQNYGFVAPAPRVAAPTISPQNYGFQAPMRTVRAPMARAPAAPAPRDDRMPSGSFQPAGYKAPAVRDDRAPMAPGAGVRAVPEGPRTDRMPSGSFQPSGYKAPTVRDDRMPAAPASVTSMAAEAARRAAANRMREQYSKYRSPPGAMPTGNVPKQDIRRDLSDIDPLGNPDKFNYPMGEAKTLTGVSPDALGKALAAQKMFGARLTTTSGLRSPFQNKKKGGVKNSQHILGKALDFSISDTQGEDTARLIDAMRRAGFTGIGGYRPGKVHGDIREDKAVWGPDTHEASIGRLPRSMQKALRGTYAGLDD